MKVIHSILSSSLGASSRHRESHRVEFSLLVLACLTKGMMIHLMKTLLIPADVTVYLKN